MFFNSLEIRRFLFKKKEKEKEDDEKRLENQFSSN